MSITETVLEMHFHRPIMELIRDSFGLGPNGQMNFFKWSPQKECFVGFDQAYVRTELGDDDFFDLLQTSAASQQYKLDDVFFGYFLQFKVVHIMQQRTISTPPTVTSLPHYRTDLRTTKNKQTGVSQHELLYRLSKNKGALVYYACPMLFDKTDLYEIDVDLEQLRLVELESCPEIYNDNDHHYIYFDAVTSDPIWKSEPHAGRAISAKEFVANLVAQFRGFPSADSRNVLRDILTDVGSLGIGEEARIFKGRRRRDIVSLTEEALTIVRMSRG